MKKVISACIDRILEFSSESEVEYYFKELERKKKVYNVVWKKTLGNGKVLIRIKTQYNQSDFME